MPAIAERTYLQEWHFFFENTRRWRDLRKITIAQVQGNAISAGLMLIWACDLIVAADDAKFSDVVGVRMGMPGVEYYAHPWEFGARKAKELLLTGDSIDADEAHRLGMVSKVFRRDELEDKTLEFARRIAERPTMAALLIKDSVNAASDAMGFTEALRHGFHIHELGHAHWAAHNENRYPVGLPPDVPDWRTLGAPSWPRVVTYNWNLSVSRRRDRGGTLVGGSNVPGHRWWQRDRQGRGRGGGRRGRRRDDRRPQRRRLAAAADEIKSPAVTAPARCATSRPTSPTRTRWPGWSTPRPPGTAG